MFMFLCRQGDRSIRYMEVTDTNTIKESKLIFFPHHSHSLPLSSLPILPHELVHCIKSERPVLPHSYGTARIKDFLIAYRKKAAFRRLS